jgi:hypothetical protein
LLLDQHLLEQIVAAAAVLFGVVDRVEFPVEDGLLRGCVALRREAVALFALDFERGQDLIGEVTGPLLEIPVRGVESKLHGGAECRPWGSEAHAAEADVPSRADPEPSAGSRGLQMERWTLHRGPGRSDRSEMTPSRHRHRRDTDRIVVASVLGVLLAVLVTPASAGGSILGIEPRSWARQGSEIRLSGTFCNGAQAPVSAGPWFAYLDPETAPPILVGKVHIAPNTGDYCQWRLTATLRVPHVAPGRYWLQVCDRGCTEGVGDLMGAGHFTVVSAAPARRQALQLQEVRARLRESMREEARQEQMLAELDDALGRAERTIAALEDRLDGSRDQLTAERNEPPAWLVAVVISALLAAATIALMTGRRRRSLVRVPDTPAELLERATAHR